MTAEPDRPVVLITGASQGIGAAIARLAAARGMRVVAGSRAPKAGRALIDDIRADGGDATWARLDVADEGQAAQAVEAALDAYGRLDVLVNNAAEQSGLMGPLADLPAEVALRGVQVNLLGPLNMAKYALPSLLVRGRGVVVNVASVVGTLVPRAEGVLYGATKAAVVSMTAALAAGYGAQGLRAYAVCPWITDTPNLDRMTNGDQEAKRAFAEANNKAGRLLEAGEVAAVILDVIDERFDVPNGAALIANGGSDVTTMSITVTPADRTAEFIQS